MNPRDKLPPEGELPLPSPRSPEQLDATILAYARNNAAPRKRTLQPAWMAGIATTCMVLLALFISEPEQAERHAERDGSAQQIDIKRSRQAPVAAESSDDSQEAVAAKATAKMPRVSRSLGAAAAQDNAVPAADAASDRLGDSDSARQEEAAAPATSNADLADQTAMLRSQIEICARLLQAGDERQALRAYRELRQRCPDCGLPDSLEQAIERYLKY